MSNKVLIINTEAEFRTLITQSEKPVLVDFWATWCPPCKIMNPILEDLAATRTDVIVAKVDVDNIPSLSAKFDIRSIPSILTFTGNELLSTRIIGAVPVNVLNKHIETILN